jgi:hypothetical protein
LARGILEPWCSKLLLAVPGQYRIICCLDSILQSIRLHDHESHPRGRPHRYEIQKISETRTAQTMRERHLLARDTSCRIELMRRWTARKDQFTCVVCLSKRHLSLCLSGRRSLLGSCHKVEDQVPRLPAGSIAAEESSSHPRREPSGGWASRNCSRKLPFPSRKARLYSRRGIYCVRWSESGRIALPLFVRST